MPVAIDTSVLISAEKQEDFDALLPQGEEGPYYIPALAASEFLVWKAVRRDTVPRRIVLRNCGGDRQAACA